MTTMERFMLGKINNANTDSPGSTRRMRTNIIFQQKGRNTLRTLLASFSGISFHKDHGLCSQPTL